MSGILNPVSSRLYRIRKTVCNMLAKRGYIVPPEDSDMTPEAFVAKFGDSGSRERLGLLVEKLPQPGSNVDAAEDRMMVFFPAADLSIKECKPCVVRQRT